MPPEVFEAGSTSQTFELSTIESRLSNRALPRLQS
jgi:hypothetical protein